MNIVAISDIYSDMNVIQEFIQFINQPLDVIILAGDTGIRTTSAHYEQDINKILTLLSKISKQVFFVSGDSDAKEFKIALPNVKNLDRQSYVIDDGELKIGLLGLGGAPTHSVRSMDLSPYLWDENVPIVKESLMMELKNTNRKNSSSRSRLYNISYTLSTLRNS